MWVFIYKRAPRTMESVLIICDSMCRLSRSPHTSMKSNRIHVIVLLTTSSAAAAATVGRSSIALPDHHIVLHAHYRCTTWRLGETQKKRKRHTRIRQDCSKCLVFRHFSSSFFSLPFFALYDITRHVSNPCTHMLRIEPLNFFFVV